MTTNRDGFDEVVGYFNQDINKLHNIADKIKDEGLLEELKDVISYLEADLILLKVNGVARGEYEGNGKVLLKKHWLVEI